VCPLSSSVARTVYTVRHRVSRWAVFLSLLLLCLPVLASAQVATIVGTVTDPSGAVVPNVGILVTNVDTGAVRTLATNDAGQYVVPGLLIGKYDLKAQASGFKVEEYKGVVLDVNDRIRIDFQMKLGQMGEAILVESNPIAVQADSGEQSSLVSGTQISELSTNGRSIYTYITLSPGAANLMPSFQPPTSVGGNLSGQVKSGQRWSGQNRPTDVARDLDVVLCRSLSLQV
jgi:Carboxypeptidase regulatory-like domain